MVRLSSAAQDAAQNPELTTGQSAAWLSAVILAHSNWNEENGTGSHGWADTNDSEAMTALLPKTFPKAS